MAKIVKCGTLIDGTGQTLEKVEILIEGDRIQKIVPTLDSKNHGVDVIDLSNMVVLPGMIDAHVHLRGTRTSDQAEALSADHGLMTLRAAQELDAIGQSGFTVCRCCGSSIGLQLALAMKEGILEGPHVVAAGLPLCQTGGHGDASFIPIEWSRQLSRARIADGPDECRRAVREQIRAGADFIKVMVSGGHGSGTEPSHRQYTLDELRAIVDEAHAAGRKVAAHAHGKAGIDNAVRAGIDTIEHGTYMDEESVLLMKEAGTYYVPTMMSMHRNITVGPSTGVSEWRLKKSIAGWSSRVRSFQLALEASIPIAVGSDSFGGKMRPHGVTAEELCLMVEHGMRPMQAILAATRGSAEACGVSSTNGTIEEGKIADIVAVSGDPLQDISLLRDVRFVMCRGRVLKGDPRRASTA